MHLQMDAGEAGIQLDTLYAITWCVICIYMWMFIYLIFSYLILSIIIYVYIYMQPQPHQQLQLSTVVPLENPSIAFLTCNCFWSLGFWSLRSASKSWQGVHCKYMQIINNYTYTVYIYIQSFCVYIYMHSIYIYTVYIYIHTVCIYLYIYIHTQYVCIYV